MGIKPVKAATDSEDKWVSCSTVESKYVQFDLEGFPTTSVAFLPTTVAPGSETGAAQYPWVHLQSLRG